MTTTCYINGRKPIWLSWTNLHSTHTHTHSSHGTAVNGANLLAIQASGGFSGLLQPENAALSSVAWMKLNYGLQMNPFTHQTTHTHIYRHRAEVGQCYQTQIVIMEGLERIPPPGSLFPSPRLWHPPTLHSSLFSASLSDESNNFHIKTERRTCRQQCIIWIQQERETFLHHLSISSWVYRWI